METGGKIAFKIWSVDFLNSKPPREPQLIKPTAHLKYDVPMEIMAHSDFDNTNRKIQDEPDNHIPTVAF